MSLFIILRVSRGSLQGLFKVSDASDIPSVMAANTPSGSSSMVVDHDHPAVKNQSGWKIEGGILTQILPTNAELVAKAQSLQSNLVEAAYQNATFQTPIDYMGTTFWTDQNSQFMLMGASVGFAQAGGVHDGFPGMYTT